MKILGLDASGQVAGVAVADGACVVAEYNMNLDKTHSETLMPMVEAVFRLLGGISAADMDFIAVTSGPGSFTGLRIGIASAKGLAFGANRPIIPVPTLDALAYNVFDAAGGRVIVPLMDARRNQAYTAFYVSRDARLLKIRAEFAAEIGEILRELAGYAEAGAIFLGDGVSVFRAELEKSPIDAVFAAPHNNLQRAASVAALAAERIGDAVSPKDFKVEYLRASQAEREYKGV